MTPFALGLVLASAVAHATWNLLAKRVEGGVVFLWLIFVLTAALWAPVALVVLLLTRPALSLTTLGLIAGTAALNTLYFALLTAGYRAGDLSLVYPLARATGPLLATVAAITLFGERPTALALAGALAIVAGALVLTGDPRALRARGAGRAALFAIATGVVIAAYTLWDKQAVSTFAIPPVVYDWGRNFGQVVLISPLALPRRADIGRHWSDHRMEIVGIAVLGPLAYILVLTALTMSPVSYVAPAREIGILIGAVMGTRLLGEGDPARRVGGAAAMVVGVVALALG
ncbi:MAG: small multidrug resistance protein [Chloroflexi bacterium 13_1_40CM_4_68_4]|nr:MAG: small multidrug resistance protein [Chloroflexi bacterium 13_1_40CM_4_68_4]